MRLLGERDLRLRGEWFNLRLELRDGLSSLRPPASSRDRTLSLESLGRSASLRFLSADRDRPLLEGDLLGYEDLSCLDVLSVLCSGEQRPFACTPGLCCSETCFLMGDRFSFPDEFSFEGVLTGFFSLSVSLSTSAEFVFLSLDLDLLLLSGDLGIRCSTIC